MDNLSYECNDNECYESNCCSLVEFIGEINGSLAFKSLELLEPGACNSGGSSRTSAGAFASADHSTISDAHSFDLIGMDSSAVISTRSLSGKSMDFLAANFVNNVHSEASINVVDIVPAQCDGFQRINNGQTLIKEDNFGMDENQVEDSAQDQTPSNAGNSAVETVIENVDVTKGADSKEGAEGHDITTTWSEGFGVGHLAILSRNERRAA